MISLKTKVDGLTAVTASLNELARNVRYPRQALNRIGEDYIVTIHARFKQQAHSMRPWKRLSEPYATRKSKQYPGKTILRRTDDLYNGFDYQVEGTRITFFNRIFYHRFHEEGTKNMVARPTLAPTPYNVTRFSRILLGEVIPRSLGGTRSKTGKVQGGGLLP